MWCVPPGDYEAVQYKTTALAGEAEATPFRGHTWFPLLPDKEQPQVPDLEEGKECGVHLGPNGL